MFLSLTHLGVTRSCSLLQVEHFGKFGVIYYDINQIITTAVMTLSKHFDTHGRIKEVQYEIFRSLMYWMTVQYDSMGRVVKRELKIGPYANTTQYRYDYDGDGQLTGVKVSHPGSCRCQTPSELA